MSSVITHQHGGRKRDVIVAERCNRIATDDVDASLYATHTMTHRVNSNQPSVISPRLHSTANKPPPRFIRLHLIPDQTATLS
ncbi:hypothetical protein BOTNAR_0545g00030 [Botryotinia narcissicola]|uniref:Uncharacterized protein n=1 Tax=Botryotinia narcissicola TaxID=278944 RepID=A0A4Z1HDC0_9HELO|nr:hypothetical protein BOTNAR_0545g00030 [Botryotinia narcissicola]